MPTVAYLGPEHTNTHLAAVSKFGRQSCYRHAPTVDDVFSLVERKHTDYGVVPIENSLEGAVTHTLDRFIDFIDTPVRIYGEIEQPIQHYLLVSKSAGIAGIKFVFSHPQALAQCRHWLSRHMPQAAPRETNSTADAVLCALRSRKLRAAIARKELASTHHLRAIPIPEERENKTRFLILSLNEPQRGNRNKTSVLFALKDRPGALHDALIPFKKNRINLTKIESRPSRRKAWEYLFFIDVEAHVSEPRLQRALKSLDESTSLLRVLGSYPIARSR